MSEAQIINFPGAAQRKGKSPKTHGIVDRYDTALFERWVDHVFDGDWYAAAAEITYGPDYTKQVVRNQRPASRKFLLCVKRASQRLSPDFILTLEAQMGGPRGGLSLDQLIDCHQ